MRQTVMDAIEAAPLPRSAPEVRAMLEGTEKGGVRNSIQNCLTVFQYDPVLSGAVAKNLLTERIDLLKPVGRKRRTGGKAMTDTDLAALSGSRHRQVHLPGPATVPSGSHPAGVLPRL